MDKREIPTAEYMNVVGKLIQELVDVALAHGYDLALSPNLAWQDTPRDFIAGLLGKTPSFEHINIWERNLFVIWISTLGVKATMIYLGQLDSNNKQNTINFGDSAICGSGLI